MVQANLAKLKGLGLTVHDIVLITQKQFFCRPKVWEGGYAPRKQWYEFVIMAEFEDVVESKWRDRPWLAVHVHKAHGYEVDHCHVLEALREAQHCLLRIVREELGCWPAGTLWLGKLIGAKTRVHRTD
jgi:hypothetical protein